MDLYLFGPPVGVTEFFLCRTYTYNRRIFIRGSRRSYRAYSDTGQHLFRFKSTRRYYRTRLETGLIQIQDLSDTELIRYRSTRRYYRAYSDTGLIRYRTYQIHDLSDTGLIRYRSTRGYNRTYSDTGLIRYRSTRGYYRTYQIQDYPWVLQNSSNTRVPIGTTELI